jgi:3-dehydrosphinganine reductase
MKNFDRANVLITGGSSGIGLGLARNLVKKGANIFLLARDPDRLDAACSEIKNLTVKPAQQVAVIQADVADYDQITRKLKEHIQLFGVPDLLINSAGITHPGVFDDISIEMHRMNMEINFFGTLNTVLAVAPGMANRKSGHILNISSLVGMHGLYGYSAYSPSKFAVKGLSDVLRYELKPYGVSVSVAFPTDTQTPQLDYENLHKPALLKALAEGNTTAISADETAEYIIKDLIKNKYLIFPSKDGKMLFAVYNILPGELFYRFVDFLMSRARRQVAKNLASQ